MRMEEFIINVFCLTVACFLCHENGYPMLQFDNLLG